MGYDHGFWVSDFSLRNSDLPLLASEAAIDILSYKKNLGQESGSIKHLSRLLNDLIQGENPRVNLPDNFTVLSFAISGREEFEKYWKDKSSDELLLQTNLVAKDLMDFENLSETKREELSDFCIRLSREVAYYRSQYLS